MGESTKGGSSKGPDFLLQDGTLANVAQLASQLAQVTANGEDATGVLGSFFAEMAVLHSLTLESADLFFALRSEFVAGVINLELTPVDMQNTVDAIFANGFPAEELNVFAAHGVSPTEILALLSALSALDLSSGPSSLDQFLEQAGLASLYVADITEFAAGFNSAPAAVPLPAALPLFAGGLGLMGWMARRRRGPAAHA